MRIKITFPLVCAPLLAALTPDFRDKYFPIRIQGRYPHGKGNLIIKIML